jgi:predicted transposase YdaD
MSTPTQHDTGYKLLFSHPEMVRDLLTGYMPGEWLQEADFTTLERVNASYVSESERQRHDDMVWRLKVGKQWVWVYLLLEFQSEPDPWMALRMMVYVGLLSQHLIREGELHEGLLPPVVPIVLYNGAAPWKAPTDVAHCYGPSLPGLEPYRPQLLYHLVDEARLKLHPMQEIRNLAEALFRLERSRTPHDIAQVLGALGAVLQGADMQPLRRTITVWVRMLLRRKAPRANIAEIDGINDLLEANAMLEQTIERWFDEATMKGVLQGVQKGRHEGFVKAVALQVQLRFGAVPAWAQTRLDEASEEQLIAWTAAILTAQSIDALFGSDGSGH